MVVTVLGFLVFPVFTGGSYLMLIILARGLVF
jgi:hypothetical protein